MFGFLELLFGALIVICLASLLRLAVYLYSIWSYSPESSTREPVGRDHWGSSSNPSLQVPQAVRASISQPAPISSDHPRLHAPGTRAYQVAIQINPPNDIRLFPKYTKRGSEASIRLTSADAEPFLPPPTAPPYEEEPPPPYEEACRVLMMQDPKFRF